MEIVEIYNKLDNELKILNPGCDTCGTCCHFDVFDHELYASTIEVNYILENVTVPPFHKEQRICPFLVDKVCSIREHRTLGCRVFFCNPHYKNVSYEIYNKYYEMIKKIAVRNRFEWHYGPMITLLALQNKKEPADVNHCSPETVSNEIENPVK